MSVAAGFISSVLKNMCVYSCSAPPPRKKEKQLYRFALPVQVSKTPVRDDGHNEYDPKLCVTQ